MIEPVVHDGLRMLLQEPPERDKLDSGSDSGDEHEVLFTPSRQQQDAPGKDAPGEMLSAKRQRAALLTDQKRAHAAAMAAAAQRHEQELAQASQAHAAQLQVPP